jgi:Rps23 Pro-64 3,4-dihydroxylase Tpa1-like proline 4-hydroxylase
MTEIKTKFIRNHALDCDALAEQFRQKGRVQIPNLLEPDLAQELHAFLRNSGDWKLVLNQGTSLFELDRQQQAQLSEKQRDDLENAAMANAVHGFQYIYETIRVPDAEADRFAVNSILADFAMWMSSAEMREWLGRIIGRPELIFADAQATAYSPGHFLTGHDDDFVGKHRLAAYVFNLTPVWRAEWGGVLLFHDSAVAGEALFPAFNCLNMFAVPQMHSVSQVTRSAAYRRYAITGWLRSSYPD